MKSIALLIVAMMAASCSTTSPAIVDKPLMDLTWRTYFMKIDLPVDKPERGDTITIMDGETTIGTYIVNPSDIGTNLGSIVGHGFNPGNPYSFVYWDDSRKKTYEECETSIYTVPGFWMHETFPAEDGKKTAINIRFVEK